MRPGQILDQRYEVLEPLAEGGMGTVYRGKQINVGRAVAIKVLHHEASQSAEMVQRFESEARIISDLRHPNTLKLIDYGRTEDGTLYLVTELLTGPSLAEVLAKGPLAVRRTLTILREICLSLAEAHDKGVVHRDLKPANVILEKVGRQEMVKVLDFGVAKVSPGEAFGHAAQTAAGVIIGTPAYMSPEVVDAGKVDGRSDLYSLGVLAYQCLAGRLPFEGSAVAQIAAHGFEDPPPLSRHVEVEEPVERLVMRLLEKKPEARGTSAAALAAELAELIQPKRRRSAWPVALGLAALAAGLYFALAQRTEPPVPPPDNVDASVRPPDPPDAGFDFGDENISIQPSVQRGFDDRDAVRVVLAKLAGPLGQCYALLDERPALVVQFTVRDVMSTEVAPAGTAAARIRQCFALRAPSVRWPGHGVASLRIAPR